MSNELHNVFNRARIDDRQINELIGISRGLIADGVITKPEAEYLQKWLTANAGVTGNPVINNLLRRINGMLSDNILDADESKELFETLEKFSGGEFELGEILKSSTLPLDKPEPDISFRKTNFCFTGTFAFGARRDCEASDEAKGASAGSLTQKTNYLVVGVYATESWAHSSYGRKIEKAVEMREGGTPIAIVGEVHWTKFL